ncbi:choline ABC transporter permease subunit [Labrys wisconsinensis]|uniref:Glycine betaine/proline transport system permease protein n=1 Tax=Labrys wisconsinensis TaxID=425677 RepID=A0ABU0J3Q0_9HYPH|nr:choline ABC transporter permease subunit [Labrys wisconsinensis]MDQ0468043.1 glycine betaine/proline transport system permease protein [Labrys wisconsinensis]
MEDWITTYKIPLGRTMKQLIDALQAHSRLFDAIKDAIGFLVDGLTRILLFVPPVLLVVLIAGLAYWLHRSVKLTVFILAAFLLIINLGYWEATVQTISLVGWSALASVLIGVPIGIAAAHRPWLYAALRPVLDLMQTLPTFVYLIPTVVLFGLGAAPGLISTVIFAIPAPIRLTQLGITSVPAPLKEAGESFGATRWQLLWKVEIPHALPTIMAGVTQCIMLCLSMVVIAALVGATGLGTPIVRALGSMNVPMGFEAGLSIVLLAIVLDRVCKSPERRSKS